LRILVAEPGPQYSVADVCNGWTDALRRLGCEVKVYNLGERLTFYSAVTIGDKHLHPPDAIQLAAQGLKTKCYEFDPDLVLIVSGFFVPPDVWELWKQRRVKTVLINTESPYEDDKQIQRVSLGEPTLNILNDPTNLDDYRAVHKHTYYLPHAYDPHKHKPARVEQFVDFSFVGTGYPSRIQFFESVDWTDIDARFGGNWQALTDTSPLLPFLTDERGNCMDNADATKLYQHSKASANLYRGADKREANRPDLAHGWSIGPREVELAATECFFLREPRGEGDDLFPMLPTFSEPGEFSAILHHYLVRDDERAKAAAQARAAIVDRTFDAHAARMLRLLPN